MKQLVLVAIILLVLLGSASALDYEEKPDITVSFYSTNYFQRGDEKTLILVVYNNAKNEKVQYDDAIEAGFFGDGNMLFTAYNLNLKLEGNDYVEIKTPEQKIPALQSMKPVTLNFIVKISDDAKPGEYELNLKAEYYIIDDLRQFVPFSSKMPQQEQYEIKEGSETKNGTILYIYKYQANYELEYVKKTKTIPIKIYIEEKPVRLEVLKVESEGLVSKGKGKITVEVKNIGEKVAKSAYLVLDTPSGIEAQRLSLHPQSAMPSGMTGMLGMGIGTGTSSIPAGSMYEMTGITGSMASTTLSTAKAAYYIGDLKPGEVANATFYLKIDTKDGGVYPLHLKAVYLDEYSKMTESESTTFGIEVKPSPKITVKNVVSRVYVNAKGEVSVTLVSDEDLKDASVRISADSPLSVLSSEYYVGGIKAGKEFTATFKLKASSEANPVTYPAELTVIFKSLDEYVELDPVRIGVKVNPKMEFEVTGRPSIAVGEERVVIFQIKNMGDFEVKDATARITIVDPFSSSDDSAFIGDLKPGESANASFKIAVDESATPKLYALNLEVKYKDQEGEWVISEPAKAVINVVPAKPPYVVYGIVLLVIIVAVVVYLRRR